MHPSELNVTFGIIRSLLDRPSANAWKELCGYLDRFERHWDDPMIQERVVLYVKQKLAMWPKDLLRYAQHLWVTRSLKGQEVPQLELATALQFISQDTNSEAMSVMFSNHLLCNMIHIDCRSTQIGYPGMHAILENPWLTNLASLDLRRAGLNGTNIRQLRTHFKGQCKIIS